MYKSTLTRYTFHFLLFLRLAQLMVLSLALFGLGAYLGMLAAQQLQGLVPTITGPDLLARTISQKAAGAFWELVRKNPKPAHSSESPQ